MSVISAELTVQQDGQIRYRQASVKLHQPGKVLLTSAILLLQMGCTSQTHNISQQLIRREAPQGYPRPTMPDCILARSQGTHLLPEG